MLLTHESLVDDVKVVCKISLAYSSVSRQAYCCRLRCRSLQPTRITFNVCGLGSRLFCQNQRCNSLRNLSKRFSTVCDESSRSLMLSANSWKPTQKMRVRGARSAQCMGLTGRVREPTPERRQYFQGRQATRMDRR